MTVRLGSDLAAGERPQAIVPRVTGSRRAALENGRSSAARWRRDSRSRVSRWRRRTFRRSGWSIERRSCNRSKPFGDHPHVVPRRVFEPVAQWPSIHGLIASFRQRLGALLAGGCQLVNSDCESMFRFTGVAVHETRVLRTRPNNGVRRLRQHLPVAETQERRCREALRQGQRRRGCKALRPANSSRPRTRRSWCRRNGAS